MSQPSVIRPAAFIIPLLLLIGGAGTWLYFEQRPKPVFDAVMPYTVGVSTPTPYGEFRYLNREPIPQGPDALLVVGPDSVTEQALYEGATVEIGGFPYLVKAMEMWSGLLPDPAGEPMAAIGLKIADGPWIAPIFCRAGTWQVVNEQVAVYFEWAGTSQVGKQLVQEGEAIKNAARWGVLDEGNMHWSSSLLPGTGFDLADGTSVTLRARDPESSGGPALRVQFREADGDTLEQRVVANMSDADAAVQYVDPTAHEATLHIAGYQNGQTGPKGGIWFAVHSQQGSPVPVGINNDVSITIPSPPMSVRLFQTLPNAVAPENSGFREVSLSRQEVRRAVPPWWSKMMDITIRQGELVTVGPYRLRYRANVSDDEVIYRFGWRPTGGAWQNFELAPGEIESVTNPRRARFDNTPAGVRVRVYGER